jgi:hypothetical protein
VKKITQTYSSDNSTRCKGWKTNEILRLYDSHDKKEDTHKPGMRELKIHWQEEKHNDMSPKSKPNTGING